MAANIIEIENFSKSFGGKMVVDKLSFNVQKGEFFAFLGTNGSGKTTTIRTLLGIYQADQGKLLVNGERYSEKQANLVGYLPEERGLFMNKRVLETIVYFGQLKNMSAEKAKNWTIDYLKKVELGDKAHNAIKTLSSGQQQKIQLAISLIGDPQILILDEPTKGLDPLNRAFLFEMLLALKEKGSTIILSTHYLAEIEKFATRLLILKNGKKLACDEVAALKKQFSGNKIKLIFSGVLPRNEKLFSAEIYGQEASLIANEKIDTQEILKYLLEQQVKIISFDTNAVSLDDIFIQISKDLPIT